MNNYIFIFLCVFIFSCNNQKSESVVSNDNQSQESIETENIQNLHENPDKNNLSLTSKNLDSSLFKGKIFRNLNEISHFKDYTDGGGAMIASLNNIDYGFLHYFKEKTHLIILMKIIYEDNNSVKYSAIDIIEIKNLPENHFITYGNCRKGKEFDSEIFSIIKYEDKEYYNTILKSWRADRIKAKIYEIDNKNIDCANDGYGV